MPLDNPLQFRYTQDSTESKESQASLLNSHFMFYSVLLSCVLPVRKHGASCIAHNVRLNWAMCRLDGDEGKAAIPDGKGCHIAIAANNRSARQTILDCVIQLSNDFISDVLCVSLHCRAPFVIA